MSQQINEASFTRQHYQVVADALRSAPVPEEHKAALIKHFSNEMAKHNPNYKAGVFHKAAGLKESVADIAAKLTNKDGKPTPLGEALAVFLESQDFTAAFDAIKPANESVAGKTVYEALDTDDLAADLARFVDEELSADKTLLGQAKFRVVLEALDVTEFKKGELAKAPADARKRLIEAAISTGVIAKDGTVAKWKRSDKANESVRVAKVKAVSESTVTSPAPEAHPMDESVKIQTSILGRFVTESGVPTVRPHKLVATK